MPAGDIILIILGGICMILGLIGCVLPILPACPLSYLGILLLHFTDKIQFTTRQLIVWGILVALVQLMDYVMPLVGAKKMGGSKLGMWGCTIGMVIGLFFTPLGIILGPFIGAVIGEMIEGKQTGKAFVAGFGSFLGFLFGTLAKVIVSVLLIYYFVAAFF